MIKAVVCELWEVSNVLEKAFNAKPLITGPISLDCLYSGAIPVKLIDEKFNIVGAYLLADEWPVLWIRAAAGTCSIDLCELMDKQISKQGAHFWQIGFQTRRAGLIKKSLKLGYQICRESNGFTQMRKNIK